MEKNEFDLIALGDTTTDVFLEFNEADIMCENGDKDCQICFNYAGKTPADNVEEIDAVGNAANNAIGASRLGLKAAIWTVIGKDQNGRQALDVFREEKVSVDLIEIDDTKKTNYSAVLNHKAERTILVFHEEREYRLPELPWAEWVYLTSMGHGWEKITDDLIKYLEKGKTKLAFNPGTHQLKSGIDALKNILKHTELFVLNMEEAQKILESKDDVKTLLKKLAEFGPKIVVITDGQKGSYALRAGQMWQVPIFPDLGPVVERTGCGDSYATATVAALFYGQPVQEALRWGSANARMVVQYVGARKGLQTRQEIEGTVNKFSEIQSKKLAEFKD